MTPSAAFEIKLAVNNLRSRHSIDDLRRAFMERTMDATFCYIGRLATDRWMAEHVYTWNGFEIVIGQRDRVFDVPFATNGADEDVDRL